MLGVDSTDGAQWKVCGAPLPVVFKLESLSFSLRLNTFIAFPTFSLGFVAIFNDFTVDKR